MRAGEPTETSQNSVPAEAENAPPAASSAASDANATPKNVPATFGASALPPPAAVRVHLKAVGSAPQLTRNKFKVAGDACFATVTAFLRTQLALTSADSLFCYLHAAFAPPPAARMEDLSRAFDAGGELVVHYSTSGAFG